MRELNPRLFEIKTGNKPMRCSFLVINHSEQKRFDNTQHILKQKKRVELIKMRKRPIKRTIETKRETGQNGPLVMQLLQALLPVKDNCKERFLA